MKQKTPQQKKALSYVKDCRNDYGENDKSSRKNIPLRKAEVNRVYRKKVNQVIQKINGEVDLDKADVLESEARNVRRKHWKKSSDMPLGKFVERQLEGRESHAGKGKTVRKKMKDFTANLKIKIEQETGGRWIAEATQLNGVMVYGKTLEEAIEKCKTLAGYVFLEELEAGKILEANDSYISVEIY